jgi:hypothetical protein
MVGSVAIVTTVPAASTVTVRHVKTVPAASTVTARRVRGKTAVPFANVAPAVTPLATRVR